MLKQLLIKGLSADNFWDLFVQCTDCRFVMPRQYFPYYHQCVVQVVHQQLGLPKAIPPPQALEDMIDAIQAAEDDDDDATTQPESDIPDAAPSDGFPPTLASLFDQGGVDTPLRWVSPSVDPVTPKRHRSNRA